MTDSLALLAMTLGALPGVGRRRVRRALVRLRQTEAFGHAAGRAALGESDVADVIASLSHVLGGAQPSVPAVDRARDRALRCLERCWQQGWLVVTTGERDYPHALDRLADPPAVLFLDGPLRALEAPHIAIVGTRDATPWGIDTASSCARAAVGAGAVVVSGLARGIDTAAHRGTVDADGVTWATLPGGLDHVYPPENRELAERIVDAGGTLLSEYPPGTTPSPQRFVERDRLQAGLAQVVLVVETGRTGGTHHTIRYARQTGGLLWCTLSEDVTAEWRPGARTPEAWLGTWDLWRTGTPRVTAEDVAQWTTTMKDAGDPARTAAEARLF